MRLRIATVALLSVIGGAVVAGIADAHSAWVEIRPVGEDPDDPCQAPGCESFDYDSVLPDEGRIPEGSWKISGNSLSDGSVRPYTIRQRPDPTVALQSYLVARKALAFSFDKGDFDEIRRQLLAIPVEPVSPSGQPPTLSVVHAAAANRWDRGSNGAWESNADFITMVRDYVAHTGDSAILDAKPARVVCITPTNTQDSELVAPGQVEDDYCSFEQAVGANPEACPLGILTPSCAQAVYPQLYPEYLMTPFTSSAQLDNPGRALSQVVMIDKDFDKLELLLTSHSAARANPFEASLYKYPDPLDSAALPEPIEGCSPTTWDPSSPQQLSGRYGRLAIDCAGDSGRYYILLKPLPNSDGSLNYFFSVGWLTDSAAQHEEPPQAGAPEPFLASTGFIQDLAQPARWTRNWMDERITFAMAWLLDRAWDGQSHGLFVVPGAEFSGRPDPGVLSSNYFDLVRFGYKDGFVNLRALDAIDAYSELIRLRRGDGSLYLPTHPTIAQTRASVRDAIADELIFPDPGDPSQELMASWIYCTDENIVCDDSIFDDNEQTRLYHGFTALQAMAARLMPDPETPIDSQSATIRALTTALQWRLALDRQEVRIAHGLFRTNLVPIEGEPEEVGTGAKRSPLHWEPSNWTIGTPWTPDSLGFATLDLQAPLFGQNPGSHWHIFNPLVEPQGFPWLGYGAFGNQEQNGGVLISNSTYMFESGPFPRILLDFRELWVKQRAIFDARVAGVEPGLPEVPDEYLRSPVGGEIRELCKQARQTPQVPAQNWHEACSYYLDIQWHLPEAGSYFYGFVKGLLDLRITPSPSSGELGLYIYDVELDVDDPSALTRIDLSDHAVANWPVTAGSDVGSIVVRGLNFAGSLLELECRLVQDLGSPSALDCRSVVVPDGDVDGIPDVADNCSAVSNPDQLNADFSDPGDSAPDDPFGNACDCDHDGDLDCDSTDTNYVIDDMCNEDPAFFNSVVNCPARIFAGITPWPYDSGLATDVNGDGDVDWIDVYLHVQIKNASQGVPGPGQVASMPPLP